MKTLKSRFTSLSYDCVWPVNTEFPAVWWTIIAVSFRRCDWLFPPSAREVFPGNRSNYKSNRERLVWEMEAPFDGLLLLFISADAGFRKFVIGWAVMSNLLACILACISVRDKHD